MAIEDSAPESIKEMITPLTDERFRFACHPGVPCFTECCRDLNLLLTPYDLLRLKNHLKLKAEALLDQYTETRLDEQRLLPTIYLKMQDNEGRTCPFVAPQGCQVYAARPAACRTYPLARASRKHRLHGTILENYFILRESHCRGFEEDRELSVVEWVQDQGLEEYHRWNNAWMEIVTHPRLQKGNGLSEKQLQMFFLAGYNLDQFRRMVTSSRFLQLFEFSQEEQEAVGQDDEALLKLAFRWIQFSLLGEPALKLKSKPAG